MSIFNFNNAILKPFSSDCQAHFVLSHIMKMSKRKQRQVAIYCFEDSRVILAYETWKLLENDEERIKDFVQRFPLSGFDYWRIHIRILITGIVNEDYLSQKELEAYENHRSVLED